MIYRVLNIPGGDRRISEPSTVFPAISKWNLSQKKRHTAGDDVKGPMITNKADGTFLSEPGSLLEGDKRGSYRNQPFSRPRRITQRSSRNKCWNKHQKREEKRSFILKAWVEFLPLLSFCSGLFRRLYWRKTCRAHCNGPLWKEGPVSVGRWNSLTSGEWASLVFYGLYRMSLHAHVMHSVCIYVYILSSKD